LEKKERNTRKKVKEKVLHMQVIEDTEKNAEKIRMRMKYRGYKKEKGIQRIEDKVIQEEEGERNPEDRS
jgi:hypothetical protein